MLHSHSAARPLETYAGNGAEITRPVKRKSKSLFVFFRMQCKRIVLSERVVYLMSSCIERNLRSMAHRKNQILREHAKGASYRGLREVSGREPRKCLQ